MSGGETALPGGLPEYLAKASIMRRRRVSSRKLDQFTEQMMLLHAPEAQRRFWKSLLDGLERGDKESMRMAGEIFKLLQKGGGFNVTQQLLNANMAATADSPVIGFDALARKLAERRAGHALPAPVDDSEDAIIVEANGGR